jgi:hypothetical protein
MIDTVMGHVLLFLLGLLAVGVPIAACVVMGVLG